MYLVCYFLTSRCTPHIAGSAKETWKPSVKNIETTLSGGSQRRALTYYYSKKIKY